MIRLDEIDDLVLDGRIKGIPDVPPFRLGDIGTRRWNVLRGDLPLPLAVLKQNALDRNAAWMADFLRRAGGLRIAPHGKTTMSPQIFARQIADGAWGITVATAQQFRVCRHFGVGRIVFANQLVDGHAIRMVLDELARDPALEVWALADSVEGVERLAEAARQRAAGRPLNLLLEGGMAGGRTGVRTLDEAKAVARALAAAAPHLALCGVEGFEGLVDGPVHGPGAADVNAKVQDFLDFLAAIARACAAEDLFAPGPVVVSAGGSAFYDMVAETFGRLDLGRAIMPLTRSGCYITHDSAMYVRAFERLRARGVAGLPNGAPEPALEVWAMVQSRSETEKAILTAGKRDLSHDADLPVPETWFRPGRHAAPQPLPAGHAVVGLNDQHAHVAIPADSPLRVGDMVSLGISHPCTTFDKWQVMCVVNADYDVVSAIRTFF
ncbi:MAG: alanine racemase [Alphaproteobacteria bacterium]